ncbi:MULTISPECIES: DUF2807 domain-containing protein [Bacteroides]|uniref:GIN domain-containing protein n=1 Tax=Bacteroides TaxID=816 RepID=UPI0004AD6A53|nr:DUF2807 domain-containing protein [Bacteroides neonati]MCP3896081.1 DUF2807 domain-containing protein [Bacteroides sp.]
MNTKLFLIATLLLIGALLLPIYAQSDKVIVRNEAVSTFSAIRMEAVGDIIFTQSDDCSFRMEGPEKYLAKLVTEVKNHTLVIRIQEQGKRNNKMKGVKYYITAPTLSTVKISGVGDFISTQPLKLSDLLLAFEGVGGIRINDLTCKNLQLKMEGVGKADIHLNCDHLRASVDGIGSVTLSGQAKTAQISKDGIGSVNTKKLTVEE